MMATQVTADTTFPLEALMAVDDPQVPIEWTGNQVADATSPVEALHGPIVTNGSELPIENTGAAANATAGNSFEPLDWLSGVIVDPLAPLEAASSPSTVVTGGSRRTRPINNNLQLVYAWERFNQTLSASVSVVQTSALPSEFIPAISPEFISAVQTIASTQLPSNSDSLIIALQLIAEKIISEGTLY